MGRPLRVGIVGAGNISGQYSDSLLRLPQLTVTAVSDLDHARAEALAAKHEGARAIAFADLLTADDVDAVLNLTLPRTHAEVALAALSAGKHVYGEKPLALTVSDGREVTEAATAAGLRLGCAPDTVLGTGVQTARAVVDAGEIGAPHSATAFMTTPGHEIWHPSPDFLYQPGGGPLLDMGPYYVTSLVHLLGPVIRVVGASARPQGRRTIGRGPRAGESFDVTVDSYVTGILEHESGALSTLIMSFDTWAAHLPRLEVHGTHGSLSIPDPNTFEGPVELFTAERPEWIDVDVRAGYLDAGRGHGLADLAVAIEEDRLHRANGDVALHVLDIMISVQEAAHTHSGVTLTTRCDRPAGITGLVDLSA